MKILYVERKPNQYVSLERVFRRIAGALRPEFETEFQQLPFGLGIFDTLRNLLLFRKRPADVYHITGHVNYIALLFSPSNTVLTFHDLRFLKGRRTLRRLVLKKLYLDLPIRRLKYITAVSENTKIEIVESTACDPAKIRVIKLPVTDITSSGHIKEFNKTYPLLLQVGTMPNKNIERLIDAIAPIRCTLRVVGKLSVSQTELLDKYGVKYENAYGLSDEEMRTEYERADIVTFCSTYEGFGLPIIEAQAAGKPLITSNMNPMNETSGGGGCLVDPFDVESIRNGVMRVIEDEEYRREIVAAGSNNVARFQIEQIVPEYERLYAEIYQNCCGGQT